MARLPHTKFAIARANAGKFHVGLALLQWILFQSAAVLFGIVWWIAFALIISRYSNMAGEAGLLAAILMGNAWWVAWIFWLLSDKITATQRRVRGWLTGLSVISIMAAVIGVVNASATLPWLIVVGCGFGFGVAIAPILSWVSYKIDTRKVTRLGLPPGFFPLLKQLPSKFAPPLHQLLSGAFDDWYHLRDLAVLSGESTLRVYVDMEAMSSDATRMMEYLLRRAKMVAKLMALAERGEPSQFRAAETAFVRLAKVATALHEAVNAVSQVAASEHVAESEQLKLRVQGLNELANYLDVEAVEAEIAPLSLDDPRFAELLKSRDSSYDASQTQQFSSSDELRIDSSETLDAAHQYQR